MHTKIIFRNLAENIRGIFHRYFPALSILSILVFAVSCNKLEELGKYTKSKTASSLKTNYFVHLTDAPGQFSQVNVDILSVLVKTDKGKEVTLNVNPGIYNLLDFRNGVDTLIATGGLDSCNVAQIRLVLGSRNSVMVDSVVYPLKVPSGEQSGLKLQVHQQLQAGVAYHVILDFDANKSVVKTGKGNYMLKPVLRTIDTAVSGSIKGVINPDSISSVVTAVSGTDTFTSIPDANGYFLFRGLAPGTYNMTITPAAPYSVLTINGIVVSKGICTNTGTHNL